MVVVVVSGGRVEVLQAAHAMAALSRTGEEVILACPPRAVDVARTMPWLAGVLPLAGLERGAPPGSVLAAVLRLRRRRIHAAMVCATTVPATLLAYIAAVPRRVGASTAPLAGLLTDRVPSPPIENRARSWLRLAEHLVGEPIRPPRQVVDCGPEARRIAEDRLVGSGVDDGRPLVALGVGVGFCDPPEGGIALPELAWPPERFAHLANHLTARHGAAVVLLGTDDDRPLADRVLVDIAAPVLDLCGSLDLVAVAAVLERCDCVVAGDSPLLHLAAAVGTPSVGLFGPTDARLRGAYGPRQRAVQALSNGGSLGHTARIRVDDVLAAIEAPSSDLLGISPCRSRP
jgi:ADP-heptose:LPS heptosyltransferase